MAEAAQPHETPSVADREAEPPSVADRGAETPSVADRGAEAQPRATEPDTALTATEPETALTPTGRGILGMIAFGRETGYDIKQLVDNSTRYFWAASYGQIYPELRRLEEQGLISGRPEPSGGRARTVYALTDAGARALHGWLASGTEPLYELRDEGMLKLFFSDAAPETRLQNVRAMRALYERKLANLSKIEAKDHEMPLGPRLTLDLGLGLTGWLIEWCKATERRLSEETEV